MATAAGHTSKARFSASIIPVYLSHKDGYKVSHTAFLSPSEGTQEAVPTLFFLFGTLCMYLSIVSPLIANQYNCDILSIILLLISSYNSTSFPTGGDFLRIEYFPIAIHFGLFQSLLFMKISYPLLYLIYMGNVDFLSEPVSLVLSSLLSRTLTQKG